MEVARNIANVMDDKSFGPTTIDAIAHNARMMLKERDEQDD
jgi:hypothetical protein